MTSLDFVFQIEGKLKEICDPLHLTVTDESHLHRVPKNRVTHLKITLVSKAFEGISLIQRHRTIYQLLSEEMQILHAISLHIFTPKEWELATETSSPKCKGGFSSHEP